MCLSSCLLPRHSGLLTPWLLDSHKLSPMLCTACKTRHSSTRYGHSVLALPSSRHGNLLRQLQQAVAQRTLDIARSRQCGPPSRQSTRPG